MSLTRRHKRRGERLRPKIFPIILIFSLLLCSAFALADSTIVATPIKNQISIQDEASFRITITNNEALTQGYSVYSFQSGQGWNVNPFPLGDRTIEINPGQSYTTTIIAKPLESFVPGIYYIHVAIDSDFGEKYDVPLKIYLAPEKPLQYLPTIGVTVDMDEKINPKNSLPIKLFLDNRNPLDMKNLTVRIDSDIPEFNQHIVIALPPLDKKTVELSITPNPFQQPKEYNLYFILEYQGEPVKIVDRKMEVITLTPPFTVDVTKEIVFLKHFYQVSVHNDGNILNTQEVKLPLTFWQILFSTNYQATERLESGQRYLVWELGLNPNEYRTVNFKINYRILFYVFTLIIVFLIFYFYVQAPVIVRKIATTTHGKDDSLSEIKITIEVKNRTSKPLHNLTVIDRVPAIANVERSLDIIGTLKPHEVKHTAKHTLVHWNILELEGHEQRLITYKIKAKLNILGTFSLPRAAVEYKKGHRSGKAYSNIFRLSS